MNKNIIFYANNDELFTFPIIYYLIKKLEKKYNIFIKLGNTSFKKKIKILLILFLEGTIKDLFKFYKKKITLKKILSCNNVELLNNLNVNKKIQFGISINYPKKIKIYKIKIYNFHFGNFNSQRGTFIFFYKKIFKWNKIDLTFHKIDKKLDSGPILQRKKINIKNMSSLDLISLPLLHKKFYYDSILKIKKNNRFLKTKRGQLNKEPKFIEILSNYSFY